MIAHLYNIEKIDHIIVAESFPFCIFEGFNQSLLMDLSRQLLLLSDELKGDLLSDNITRAIYSTDASVYCEEPLAVAWPANTDDIVKLLRFCKTNNTSFTVRAAGTSLAGQVVSGGIIADITKYMNRILEFNKEERWVLVEPGVVLDELNQFLKPSGLFFGPETSTSNRCTIGGMVGNNACGLHSLVYGSTREHLLEVKCILSDGSEVLFRGITKEEFTEICSRESLEGHIHRNIWDILSNPANQKSIREEFPDGSIPRRNTGYCLDLLLDTKLFSKSDLSFSFASLIAGSEGTLAIAMEIKLNLLPLPPPERGLLCVHLKERRQAFYANLIALKHDPSAVEMMDDKILRLTENNLSQRNNRFFIKGDPEAILIIEFNGNSKSVITQMSDDLIVNLKRKGLGYHFPLITGKETSKVWDLRKAGLGILSNMKGDKAPVSLIEDAAINVESLPEYMDELTSLLESYGKEVVLHAHIGTGELHVRPILNLKDKNDVLLFREIGEKAALLVKKYRGSISGEHGDGRLRGEFISIILGENNYKLLEEVKKAWDPDNILNPGKIVNSLPMDSYLRYEAGIIIADPQTIMDFSDQGGILRASEKCNGSADCRKSVNIGGTMCPSYMATGDERLTTRARANILRQQLPDTSNGNWNHPEIYEILDLCLSCKGCKAECPSGVDMAKMKAEFLQHWQDENGIPLRSRLIANITSINKLGSLVPALFNFVVKNRYMGNTIKRIAGFAAERSIPSISKISLRKWIRKNLHAINPKYPIAEVCLFIDEFSNYNDTSTGINTIRLLTSLNYKILTVNHAISGRSFISKGLLRKAAKLASINVELLFPMAEQGIKTIGIEPSAILSFRDEYPDLLRGVQQDKARKLAESVLTLDEFLAIEHRAERIKSSSFTDTSQEILVHVHCQQKALCGSTPTIEALSIPRYYSVTEIPSGCCGMAGSFGYEKEHFELSNKIGELVLFPEIRKVKSETVVSAPGTSCRHHIADGTGRKALHTADVLYHALKL